MKELQITARFRIHVGKLDQFKMYAKTCMERTRAKDTGTLQYDWFINEAGNECVLREKFVSSDALLEHFGNLGDRFGELLGVADMSAEVCGTPSEALLKATEGIPKTVYSYFQGLEEPTVAEDLA